MSKKLGKLCQCASVRRFTTSFNVVSRPLYDDRVCVEKEAYKIHCIELSESIFVFDSKYRL